MRANHTRLASTSGFTLVEVLVVSPIILLTIVAFIGAIIYLTGQALTARADNALALENQSALNIIEQDIRLSRTFQATVPFPIVAPQGRDNATGVFKNASSTATPTLLLEMMNVTNNVNATYRRPIYLANSPHPCGSVNIEQNQLLSSVVVYFVKDETLWRRTLMPAGYNTSTVSCDSTIILARPSCDPNPAVTGTMCVTRDMKLASGVKAGDFTIAYYATSDTPSPNATASSTTATDASRQTALTGTTTIRITLKNSKRVAGNDTSYTGQIRATRLSQSPL